MAKKALNFKNTKSYHKWVGYVKANKLSKAKGNTPVKIAGKTHRVKHTDSKRK